MKKDIGMEVYSRISDMSPPREVQTSGRAWQARNSRHVHLHATSRVLDCNPSIFSRLLMWNLNHGRQSQILHMPFTGSLADKTIPLQRIRTLS